MSLYAQYQKETKTSNGGLYAQYQASIAPPDPSSFGQIVKNTVSDLGSFAAQTGKDIWGALTTKPAPKSLDMQKSLKVGWDTISATVQDTSERFQKLSTALTTPVGGLKKAVATGEALMGVVNNLFLGITAPMKAAASIPVVGYVADGVNNLFSALGVGGADVVSKAVDGLPMSQQTRDTIRPLAQEIGALTAQIAAGKLGNDGVVKIKAKSKEILDTINSELQVAKTTVQGRIPKDIKVSGESVAQPVSFYNKYQAEQALPIIQMGVKPKETLPTIQIGETSPRVAPPVVPESAPTAPIAPVIGEIAPVVKTRATQAIKPIEGTGEVKTRGVAESIEATAIEKGIVDTLGDLPQYKAVNFKEQATLVSDLISKDPEGARAIALGDKPAPNGVIPEMVAVGVEKQAIKVGDVQTLIDLTNSKLTVAGTTMGQRIAAYGQRDVASPIGAIQDIQTARAATIKTRGVDVPKEVVKETANMKREVVEAVKKSRPKWEDFIKEITCGY